MPLQFTAASSMRLNMGAVTPGTLANQPGATLMAFINITSFPSTESWIAFYSTNSTTTTTRLALSLRSTGSLLRTTSRRLDNDAGLSLDNGAAISTGVWHHVCAVSDWTGGMQYIYIDGVLSNSAARAGWTENSSNTNSLFRIGSRADDGAGTFANAIIKDVRIYNVALSINQIKAVAYKNNADAMFENLRNRWRLQEGSAGSTATGSANIVDDMGTTQYLTPVNSPVYTVSPLKRRRVAA